MGDSADKRDFHRAEVHVEARAISGETTEIHGMARDVSIKGMFLETDVALPLGAVCDIALFLRCGDEHIEILAKGVAARSNESGIAIEFTEIDSESIPHLRQLVLYNSPDTEPVEEELEHSVGIRRQR